MDPQAESNLDMPATTQKRRSHGVQQPCLPLEDSVKSASLLRPNILVKPHFAKIKQ